MPATRITVPALTGGVSRQPPTQRLPNQLEDAENCIMWLSRGFETRPGTIHIAGGGTNESLTMNGDDNNDYIWIAPDGRTFLISIDASETVSDDMIRVFDAETGEEKVVVFDAGQEADLVDYINDNVASGFASVSIGRTTIIAGKDVTVAFDASTESYLHGGTAVHDSSHAHYKDTALDFPFPPAASNEYWFAESATSGFPRGFYKSANHTGPGPWYLPVRTEEANSELDQTTMPFKIVWDGTDTFTVSFIDWDPRYSGSSLTNPGPGFVGKKISDMIFHRGRLFISAGDRIVGSEVNNFYNFWVRDPANLNDKDVVDVSVGDAQITDVKSMTAFNKALILQTSGAKQFELRADGPLTPTSANILPSTSIDSTNTKPATLGNQMYWASDDGVSSKAWAYAYAYDAASNTAVDVSVHAQSYLPGGVDRIVAVEGQNMVLFHATDDVDALYIYQMYYSNLELSQAAWYKWTFPGVSRISTFYATSDVLYFVMKRGSNYYLEKMILNPNAETSGVGYRVCLDRQVVANGAYDSATQKTVWTNPLSSDTVTTVVFSEAPVAGKFIVGSTVSATEIKYPGSWEYAGVIGVPYKASGVLSEQFARDQNNKRQSGFVQLLSAEVHHKDCGPYQMIVTPRGVAPHYQVFTPARFGISTTNEQRRETGKYQFKVLGRAFDTVISFESISPVPIILTSITFRANFVPMKGNPVE